MLKKRCMLKKKLKKELHAGFYPRINSLQRDKSVRQYEQPRTTGIRQ